MVQNNLLIIYYIKLPTYRGLVHHSANISQGESAIISGTLAGMAADQESVVVIDQDARDAESNVQSNSRQRQLRDIVRESTNQWMLNTEGADAEYVKELTSMGYCNEGNYIIYTVYA
jgi:hypothetical protein